MRLKNEYLCEEIEEFLESVNTAEDADELADAVEEAKQLLEDTLTDYGVFDQDNAETIRNHLENLWDLIPPMEQVDLEDSFSDIMNALECEMDCDSENDDFEEEDEEL